MKEGEWKRNKHINRDKIGENIILKQDDIEELYEQEFGEALEKYNAKQRRKDRKIDNYYEHVKNGVKTNAQQEMIIQVGALEDIENGTMGPNEARDMLQEWYEGFEERNPNLKVYNAIIHMDEATPHLHINFVPVVHGGYKRGLESQVSFDGALFRQDDTLDKKRPYKQWRDKEVGELVNIMQGRNIDRKLVGTHESMTVDRYKEVKDREKKVENAEKGIVERVKIVKQEIAETNGTLRERVSKLKEGEKVLEGDKSDFKQYVKQKEEEIEAKKQELDARSSVLDIRERKMGKREKDLQEGQKTLETSQTAFEDHMKTRESEIRKELEDGLVERQKIFDENEQDLADRRDKVTLREIRVTDDEKGLDAKEKAFKKKERAFKVRQVMAKSWEKVQERFSSVLLRFTQEEQEQREKLAEVVEEFTPLENENLPDFSKALDDLADDGEITLNADDIADLKTDKPKQL